MLNNTSLGEQRPVHPNLSRLFSAFSFFGSPFKADLLLTTERDNPKPHKHLEVRISATGLSFALPDASLEALKNKILLLVLLKMIQMRDYSTEVNVNLW